MFEEIIMMSHVFLGVLGTLAGFWVFVEVLNVSESNKDRIKSLSIAVAVLIWISYLIAGFYYVTIYGTYKPIVKAGPWPWAHLFFMEVKEHMFFMLLLLSTYLPIVVHNRDLLADKSAYYRYLVLAIAGLIVLLGLSMEGFGSVVSMGVRLGLLSG